MEEVKENLLCQLLECGPADTDKLCYICIKNGVIPDVERARSNFGKIDLNILMYETIREVAENFIFDYKSEIHRILNLGEYGNLDEYRSYNDLYEIYVNGLDSHLWIKNDEIQNLFEASKYEI